MNSGVFLHPYLTVVLLLCVLFLCCVLIAGPHRKTLILVGAISVPGSFLSFVFVPDYWNPVRLFEVNPGIEDVLFSFVTGALVWFLSANKYEEKGLKCHKNRRVGVKRYFKMVAIGAVTLALVSRFESLNIMSHILITMFITSLLVGWHYKDMVSIALSNSVLFGVFYTSFLVVTFQLFPQFESQWNSEHSWGVSILSIPLEEIVWAFSFGFTWTLITFYLLYLKQDEVLENTGLNPLSQG